MAIAFIAIAVVIAMYSLASRGMDAERSRGDERVVRAELEQKLIAATLASDTWKARSDEHERRADALNDLLVETVNDMPEHTDLRARLQARWLQLHTAANSMSGSSGGVVQDSVKPADPKPGQVDHAAG